MIPIFICDDQAVFLKQIESIIEKYIFIEDNNYQIACATHDPVILLEQLSSKIQRGIYFLDVSLRHDKYNGFTLAQEIRKLDSRGFIIFITSHDELAFETFRYRLEAMDYIVKGDSVQVQQRVFDCMRSVSRRLLESREVSLDYFPVKIGTETQFVPYDDILYFETSTQKHRILLHTKTMHLEFFSKLQDIAEQLPAYFKRSHRSFIVNTQKITKIDFKEHCIYIQDIYTCPLARNNKQAFRALTLHTDL